MRHAFPVYGPGLIPICIIISNVLLLPILKSEASLNKANLMLYRLTFVPSSVNNVFTTLSVHPVRSLYLHKQK